MHMGVINNCSQPQKKKTNLNVWRVCVRKSCFSLSMVQHIDYLQRWVW